jgi:hypothetical protein
MSMRDSERNVGRADHNLDGARDIANGGSGDSAANEDRSGDSADQRAHGTHGRGRGEEQRFDDEASTPPFSKGTDRGGSDAWGNASSGGSTFDKRSPEK